MANVVFFIDDGEDALYLWDDGVASTNTGGHVSSQDMAVFWRVIDQKLCLSYSRQMLDNCTWLANPEVQDAFERHVLALTMGPEDSEKL